MMPHPLPKLVNNLCSKCGSNEMMLAQDYIEYSPCEFENGQWTATYSHEEESLAENAVRFYCARCGQPHVVPEELP